MKTMAKEIQISFPKATAADLVPVGEGPSALGKAKSSSKDKLGRIDAQIKKLTVRYKEKEKKDKQSIENILRKASALQINAEKLKKNSTKALNSLGLKLSALAIRKKQLTSRE